MNKQSIKILDIMSIISIFAVISYSCIYYPSLDKQSRNILSFIIGTLTFLVGFGMSGLSSYWKKFAIRYKFSNQKRRDIGNSIKVLTIRLIVLDITMGVVVCFANASGYGKVIGTASVGGLTGYILGNVTRKRTSC